MKSRRDFLAAAGLTAGALGLPGTARAWFGRRRRVSYSPASAAPCPCAGGEGRHGEGCVFACPQYLYVISNGMYWYYCQCCTIPNDFPIVPTPDPVTGPLPVLCTAPNNFCFNILPPDHAPAPEPGDCTYAYYAKDPTTGAPVATPYINGIDPKDARLIHEELVSGGPNAGLHVNGLAYGRYVDPKGVEHLVALYDLSRENAVCPLHIGQDVTGTPVANLKPQHVTDVTGVPGYPHYNLVRRYRQGPVYHVATKK